MNLLSLLMICKAKLDFAWIAAILGIYKALNKGNVIHLYSNVIHSR